jgi:hypothetical protein
MTRRCVSQLLKKISDVRAFGNVHRQHPAVVGRQPCKLGVQVDLDLHRASVSTPPHLDR